MSSSLLEHMTSRELPAWAYRVILISCTLIWGGNFVVAKGAVTAVGATWVIGIRFFVAGLIMLVALLPHMRRHLTPELVKAGCLIGLFSFLGYGAQFLGLQGTTPSKNAFLSTCYCVITPFVWWLVAHRRPTGRNLLAAAICVGGMALITLQGDLTVSWGDGVSMLSAVLYGIEIVAIAKLIRSYDVLTITAVQMISSGVYAMALALALHQPLDVSVATSPAFLAQMAYIIILGSCYASTAQNLAQTHVPPAQASLFFALESVFGTVFSVLFYGEVLTLKMLAGFALIFAAILISELKGGKDVQE
ncbi:MAG: DMT family transporter [Coriobacteriia bacterium]|nr:DMT family transporter [Coriobacteriia bacterium]